ncbi:hypothetical protein DZB85_11960 [Bacillus sp. LB(2018)]|nr:hypothetical protein DZB88_07130 [Bacillus sp. OE]RFB25003.1 hypothetical protein DZB85_11960 [Bacillus sp. LB(2018)]
MNPPFSTCIDRKFKKSGSDNCRIPSLRMLVWCSSSKATLRSSWLQCLELLGSLNPPFSTCM